MPALRKRLREESYVKRRGDTAGPAAIFVNEEEMPGGIRPSGNYTVTDKAVVVSLNLKRDDKKTKIRVEGAADDKDALVLKIFSAVLEASKTPLALRMGNVAASLVSGSRQWRLRR
jgi:hypothetical protein